MNWISFISRLLPHANKLDDIAEAIEDIGSAGAREIGSIAPDVTSFDVAAHPHVNGRWTGGGAPCHEAVAGLGDLAPLACRATIPRNPRHPCLTPPS